MKLRNIAIIGLLVALSLIYTWYEANRPQPLDWSDTYSPKDKIPYGTYVVYHSLSELFPESEVYTSRLSINEALDLPEVENAETYVYIERYFNPDPVEMDRLLSWTEEGKDLFIAAEGMADTLLSLLSLEIETDYRKEKTLLTFPGAERKTYSFNTGFSNYFIPGESFRGDTLGIREHEGRPDFLRIPYGQGQIWLNLNPRAFTNRWALDSTNGDYYYRALSWLPDKGQTLVWDAYKTLGRPGEQTPLRVVLRYPALRLALYLLLAYGMLYLFFRAKREQRPIPVVSPPENRMLGFISMLSSLFYKQQEHSAIALKQIDFFLGEVRAKYYIPTDRLDEQFVRLLSERSGVERHKTEELVHLITVIQGNPQVTEEMLSQLMRGTDLFTMFE